jgi:uncharacterized membrane protein
MKESLITDPFGLIAVLVIVPTIIFLLADHPKYGKLFTVIPSIVFAYFVPTLLANWNVLPFFDTAIIPNEAPIYSAIKKYLIPAALILLVLAVDIKGIIGLGRKAVIMFLAATLGIVIGGPLSLWIWQDHLPAEVWKGMGALAGSWIGGGANFTAMGDALDTPETMMGAMVIVDVLAANIWTGILMFFAGKYMLIDKKMGADNSAIEDLKNRVVAFQKKTAKVTSVSELMLMVSLAFGGSYLCYELSFYMPEISDKVPGDILSHGTWKYILVTTFALGLSFTKLRNLDGAGASNIGTLFLYILIAVIGAGADLLEVYKEPYLIAMGLTWISFHAITMLIVMKLIKAPLFFMAVGSQANVGGAASAPIVASAFHPSLATVGVMLGIAGYVLGTYAAIICAQLLRYVSAT